MRLSRVLLQVSAVAFAGFGLAFSLAPTFMAGLVEVELPTPTARIDFVATYGGLELGIAAFLLLCSRRDEWVRVGLLASGLFFLGFALARLAGIAGAGGDVRSVLFALLAAEVVAAALSFWAARL